MSSRQSARRAAEPLRSGRVSQKLRTRKLLLETAAALIARGQTPGVADVADAAGISRRTAWRYFPTRERLLADAALEGLRPVMESAIISAPAGSDPDSLEARICAVVERIMRLALENEGLLRTMIHATVLQPASRVPRRGNRRVQWIEDMLEPCRERFAPDAWTRLVSALAVCIGTEALLVLRDIRGLTPTRVIQVCQWMAVALVRQAMADDGVGKPASGRGRKPARR